MVHGGAYLNDLLPLPYTAETLRVVVAHLAEVQDVLGRAYVIENPSSYVSLATSTMTELEFLHALVNETGCRLLAHTAGTTRPKSCRPIAVSSCTTVRPVPRP